MLVRVAFGVGRCSPLFALAAVVLRVRGGFVSLVRRRVLVDPRQKAGSYRRKLAAFKYRPGHPAGLVVTAVSFLRFLSLASVVGSSWVFLRAWWFRGCA